MAAWPPHILVMNYEYPPIGGGGGVLCRDLSEALVQKGTRISVLTSRGPGARDYQSENGIDVYRVPVIGRTETSVASIASMLSYVVLAIVKARALAKSARFDLVHTYFAVPTGPAGQAVARSLGVPNVLSLMGGDVYDPSKRLSPHRTVGLKQVVRRCLIAADEVVALSSDLVNRARTGFGIEREMPIIPAGVPPLRAADSNAIPPKDGLRICTVGRIVSRKNLAALIDVFSRVCREVAARLVIIGEGPEETQLMGRARRLGCAEQVEFLGRVTDKEKFAELRRADIYVSTATHEGFGIVFLEAMQCGLPVICYDRGGHTDYLIDGKTGAVIPLHDESRFTEALRRLAQDGDLRKTIGEYNRKKVKDFEISACADRYADLFRRLCHSS